MTITEDRRDHVWFLENLDRVNRAMQGTNDLEAMMSSVLDATLEIFDCDRAWLIHPCDPEAVSCRAVMEHTRPEFPGAFALGLSLPVDTDIAAVFRAARAARGGALLFGPAHEQPLAAEPADRYRIRSQMIMALHPKGDQPYLFGLHQCSSPRSWTPREQRLFEETGYRLTDALTSLLMFRSLRESERRLDDAQRIAHVGYWDGDPASGELSLSDEACGICGLATDGRGRDPANLRERWLAVLHPDDRGRVVAAADAALRGGPAFDVEYRVVRPGGELRVIHSRGEVVPGEGESQRRMFGMIQDITDLRRTEAALRASEERFRTFADHAADAFYLLDHDGTVLDVNPQACATLGYTRDELIGMHPRAFDVGLDVEAIGDRLRAGETVTFETLHRRKDGTVFPVEIRSHPFEQGGRRFLCVVRDVGDRKRAEEERRDHIWFLESMDRVNRAMQRTDDLERMVDDVLDVVIELFGCDAAALMRYAGDSTVTSLSIAALRARPGFTPSLVPGVTYPADEGNEALKRALRAAGGPLQFVRGATDAVYERQLDRFVVDSALAVEVVTKLRDSEHFYAFAVGQAAVARVWTARELRLFEEIGRRLGDSLSTLSMVGDLRRSEARLEEAQRLAHVGHWEWDVDSDRFTFSDETASILGLPPQQQPTTCAIFRSQIRPEDPNLAVHGLEDLLADGSRMDYEHRVIRPGGGIRDIHVRGTGVRDESGKVRRMFGTIQDVTERKRAEEQLRAADDRFRTYVDHATDALFVFDDETGELSDVNRQACESLGYTREELLRMAPPDFDPQVRPEDMERMKKQIVAGHTFSFESVHRRQDGSTFPVELRVRPFSRDGRRYALSLARDITERKQAEEERERVRRLEAELAHVNRVSMMGELAAALSHELKQPITAAMTNANACLRWLKRGEIEEARKSVTMILHDGNRAADIMDRMRSFYRKGAPPERELIDVNEVIGEMLVLMRSESMRHSIPMRTELAAELPPVLADRVQLQQVLMNLMLNGIEAMRDTGGELTIRSQRGDDGAVLIAVRDTGVGLPADGADQIFRAFFTTKRQGSGMGLAISRSIVEAHGGRLWATANARRGATFQFSLPAP